MRCPVKGIHSRGCQAVCSLQGVHRWPSSSARVCPIEFVGKTLEGGAVIDGDGGNGLFKRETGREKFSTLPGDFGSRGDTGGLLLKGDVGDVGCRLSKVVSHSHRKSRPNEELERGYL